MMTSRYPIFAKLALATLVVLSIPLVAMQVSPEVNWTVLDFLVMGVLLFTCSSGFVLVSRRIAPAATGKRIAAAAVFALVFLYAWAELAVGIFFDFGS